MPVNQAAFPADMELRYGAEESRERLEEPGTRPGMVIGQLKIIGSK